MFTIATTQPSDMRSAAANLLVEGSLQSLDRALDVAGMVRVQDAADHADVERTSQYLRDLLLGLSEKLSDDPTVDPQIVLTLAESIAGLGCAIVNAVDAFAR